MIDLNSLTGTFALMPLTLKTPIEFPQLDYARGVKSIQTSQTFEFINGKQFNVINLNWDYLRNDEILYKGGVSFTVEFSSDGVNYESFGLVDKTNYILKLDYNDYKNIDLTFRIMVFEDYFFSESITTNLIADTTEAITPEEFTIYVNEGNTSLAWSEPVNDNASHYVLRYSPINDFNNSHVVNGYIKNTNVDIPTRLGYYFLTVVNASGLESTSFKMINTTIPELGGYKLIQTINESPTFDGVLTGFEILSNKLVSTSTAGEYELDAILDLGGIYTVRIESRLTGDNFSGSFNTLISYANQITSIADWTDLSAVTDISTSVGEYNAFRKITAIDITGRKFKFKFKYNSITGVLTLDNYDIKIYLPARKVEKNSISSGVIGYNVLYDNDFYEVPSISTTSSNMATGDYYVITSETVSGFTITFYDSTNTEVNRTFNYVVNGYGRKNTEIL
jgi:hypothetical protein